MNAEEVKTILGITTHIHDAYLDAVIPLFEEKIKRRANNRFVNSSGKEVLPADLQHTLAKWIEWDMNTKQGIDSRKMGEVSYNYDNDLPDFVKRDIAPHRRVRF